MTARNPADTEQSDDPAIGAVRPGAASNGTAPIGEARNGGFDRRLIAPLVLGAALNPVNSSMIAVALVPIGASFGAVPSETAWLVSALYLATAIGQPVVGRLVDRHGPRRLYLAGAALVGVAGLIGVLATSFGVLIAARVLLGFGTCAGYPAAMYLIRSESRRTGVDRPGPVLTLLTVAAQTIVVVGPTLGGLLIAGGGWRTVFAINIPLASVCLLLGRRLPRAEPPSGPRRPLDLPGIVLFTIALTTLMIFLMSPAVANLWLAGLALASGAGFAVHQLRVTGPFIDLRVLGGNRPLINTFLRTLCAQTITYAFLYGFTLWLEAGRHLNAATAGLVLLPMSLVAIVASTLTGRSTRLRAVLLAGAITQFGACALLFVLGDGSPMWLLVLVAAVCGLPQGLNNLANQNAVYHQADPSRIGASAGLLRTFTYLGAMVSAAAYGTFFHRDPGAGGLHAFAWFLLAVAATMLVLVVADPSLERFGRRSGTPTEEPATKPPGHSE